MATALRVLRTRLRAVRSVLRVAEEEIDHAPRGGLRVEWGRGQVAVFSGSNRRPLASYGWKGKA